MRKLGNWGGWAVLLLALGTAAASAAPPTDDDDKGSAKPVGPDPAARPRDGWNPFITKLFGGDSKKPTPKSDADKDGDKKRDEPAPRSSTLREIAAHYRALEEAKLHRRQAVCARLREIAQETHDEELDRKAQALDNLAFEVFEERISHLPLKDRAELRSPAASDSPETVREGKP